MANLEWASDLAVELIAEYGADITIKIFTPGVVDPDKPWEEAPPIETSVNTKGVFTLFKQEHIDGTLIKQEDRRVLVAGLSLREASLETRLNGHIILGSNVWQIISISQVAPDENTILYVFQVRK